ncbi:cora-domain-containing protein [Meira miltonrushii]|uniref:Cora-domain-containing protein n=1 Tax=Meira miltonrushii TaxID=1280837 RepID=A0A316VBI3_9BASI|nr:cora-domain-containing protein [Meira miltonrushii]PWN34468.1 cora-domain-containing protein [Meira miltonrushii]
MSSPPKDSAAQSRAHTDDSRTVDHAQLEQDIDAARQMNRARVNSNNLHRQQDQQTAAAAATTSATSDSVPSNTSFVRSGRSGSIISPSIQNRAGNANALDNTTVNDYIGIPASSVNQSNRQPTTPGGQSAIPPNSFSPSSPVHVFQQQQQAAAAQAQAARFYMQHQRHGSNTSLDSASHFIDHRNQQSIGVTGPISPSYRASSGRLSMSRPDGAIPSSLRQGIPIDNASALDDEPGSSPIEDALNPHSFAQRHQANPRSHSNTYGVSVGRSVGSGRGQRSERLVDIEDENDHSRLGLSSSQRSAVQTSEVPHTPSRRPSLAEDDVCFPIYTPGADQLGGMEGAPELARQSSQMNANHIAEQFEQQQHATAEMGANAHQTLPPGFPWTFDLNSLQEYAEQEKKRVQEEATASTHPLWSNSGNLRNRSGAATIAGTRDIRRQFNQDQSFRSSAYGISPDSDDATFYSRRPRRYNEGQGTESDAKSSGRYQRKLALFEGAGTTPPPIGSRSLAANASSGRDNILGKGTLLNDEVDRHRAGLGAKRMDSNGFPIDNKTPLLDSASRTPLPSYRGTSAEGAGWSPSDDEDGANGVTPVSRSLSVGANLNNLDRRSRNGQRPMRAARHTRAGSYGSEKQYRFTFYSNALPNTIHARHLYELPAPGQTFEELLMGVEARNSNQTDNEQEDEAETHPSTMETGNIVNPAPKPNNTASSSNNKGVSALTSALMNSGRLEGSTAPNTGANTPDHVPNVRTATLTSNAAKAHMGQQIGGQHALPGANSTTAALPAATMEKARALPGGGYRVEQDPETCTWWLDVLCPTDQEMKTLSRVFGIHPLTTEDILMEETREKIELFRNYYLVCFRSFDQDPYSPTYLEPLNMYVIVFREGTLSFHFRATPHPQNVRRRIKQLKDYINVTSDWISYALIDDITDAFGPLIQSIEYEVDSIDELVLILKEAEQSDMLRRIGTCRKKVMGLLRLMGNKADVVKGLAKRCNENWSVAPKSDIGLYLSDIQDHLITMTQNLNHYEKILSRSHSNYLAQISIEMTDANNQINDVLSKLTALGTVIVPLNVITGLWGMNVHVPGQDIETLDWFFGILAVMVALAVVGYFATIRYLSR